MYCFFLTNTHMINICKTSYNIKKRQNKKSPIGDFFLSLHNKKTLSALILPTEVDLISKVAKISLSAGLLARNHLPLFLPSKFPFPVFGKESDYSDQAMFQPLPGRCLMLHPKYEKGM